MEAVVVIAWTPKRIAQWLRLLRDWEAEIESEAAVSCSNMGGAAVVAGRHSDPTSGTATYMAELAERCRIVRSWLDALSPAERIAAEWWLADGEASLVQMAERLGVTERLARHVVKAVPITIYWRFYAVTDQLRVDEKSVSS